MKSIPFLATIQVLLMAGLFPSVANSQTINKSVLTIKEIMSDNYVGNAPSRAQWSSDSKSLFFNWKPDEKSPSAVYRVDPKDPVPVLSDRTAMQNAMPEQGIFSKDKHRKLETKSE